MLFGIHIKMQVSNQARARRGEALGRRTIVSAKIPCQHNTAPRYLTAQLQQASNIGYRQRLRSSSSAKLDVPRTEHVTIGGRAFSSTAAHVWNSLSTVVQSSESLDIYRRRLKTELFERSNNWHRACQTTLLLRDSLSLSRSFLLWLQPWSLLTIMLLWHSFLIIINNNNTYCAHYKFHYCIEFSHKYVINPQKQPGHHDVFSNLWMVSSIK